MKEEYTISKYLETFFRIYPIPKNGYTLSVKSFRAIMRHAFEYGGGSEHRFLITWERMNRKPTKRVNLSKEQMKKMLTQFFNAGKS